MHSKERRTVRRGGHVQRSVGFGRGIPSNGMDGAGRTPETEDGVGERQSPRVVPGKAMEMGKEGWRFRSGERRDGEQ